MALRSCAPAFGVALLLAGCADGPSPVTARKSAQAFLLAQALDGFEVEQ